MKFLSFLGSPNRNGNTAEILDRMEKRLSEHGHEAERVYLKDFTIHGCQVMGARAVSLVNKLPTNQFVFRRMMYRSCLGESAPQTPLFMPLRCMGGILPLN
ncbi:MAG: NAD(P)H-dependent oxidoreductase [Veillonellales bacterium]